MNLNYEELQRILNEYAIDCMKNVLITYNSILPEDKKEEFKRIISNNKALIVDSPNDEDLKRFGDNIPAAQGPRGKGDGFIHVYPYKFTKDFSKHPLTQEEILEKYTDGQIILHEVFHYIFKLDIQNPENNIEEEFGHFITEGMVQYMTEETYKRKDPKSNYRKNVDIAEEIYKMFTNINVEKRLFELNIKEACKDLFDYKELLNNFIKTKNYTNELNELIIEICKSINIDPKKFVEQTKNKSLKNVVEYIEYNIKIVGGNQKEYYLNKLSEITNKYTEKEKGLK